MFHNFINFFSGKSRESSDSDSNSESTPPISPSKQLKTTSRKRTNQDVVYDINDVRWIFGENGEYIEAKWRDRKLIELKSFQFIFPTNNKAAHVRRQGSDYLFVFDDEVFIARAVFNDIENLFETAFKTMKEKLLKRLVVTEIIKDSLLIERDSCYDPLSNYLHEISYQTANNLNYAEDIFQLNLILQECSRNSNKNILEVINNNSYISQTFWNIGENLLHAEETLKIRRRNFPGIDIFCAKNVTRDLKMAYETCVKNHKQSLIAECSLFFSDCEYIVRDQIKNFWNSTVLLLSNNDIRLFSDMDNEIKGKHFSEFFDDLQTSFFRYVKAVNNANFLQEIAPLTDSIYCFFFKSFREIATEIGKETNMTPDDFLEKHRGSWQLLKSIEWLQPPSLLNKSLEQQLRFTFRLMKHFEPGCQTRKTQFIYDFKILQDGEWRAQMSHKKLVWMYFLDNAISGIVTAEQLKWYESLIEGCKDFLTKTGEQYESFRVISQNCARFIVQTSPYLSENVVKTDQVILKKQIEYINKAIKMEALTNFRDLIDVYNEYWSNRERISVRLPEKFPHGQFKEELKKISQGLLDLLLKILSYDVQPQEVIKYFRVFNEFVVDLDAVDFRWIVKKEGEISDSDVSIVNESKSSYVINDPEEFLKSSDIIPRHFVIEIIQELLNHITKLLNDKNWSEKDQLNGAADLISSIKKSFLYLKDQSDYVSFETFKDESTKPFIFAVENSSSYGELSKRVGVIGESFWYIRKQDEIDIEKALELYSQENSGQQTETMRTCYNIYLDKFNYFVTQTFSKQFGEKIEFVVDEVQEQLDNRIFNTWDTWDKNFKREVLLEVLAGLAAVWSILESKDIAVTGKSLKPHCIQILCIIRLMSIDEDRQGVDKHLAQVLTGQGKSLVLGLMSALLALTDHKVRTVCYSKYLATRDQEDFAEFFKVFYIGDQIVYETFEEMANDLIRVEVDGKKQDLRSLMETRILKHNERKLRKVHNKNVGSTVLLIDEVDVFFSDQFYGNVYRPCQIIYLPGLAEIQEKIWELVLSGNSDENTIYSSIESFIEDKRKEGNSDFKEFNKYLSKEGQFWLLDYYTEVIKKEYNNGSLFWEHLKKMINDAVTIKATYCLITKFVLCDNGKIALKKSNGIYSESTYDGYNNIFAYFRLKKKNFDKNNYGYLQVHCGNISYAKLPTEYPLILGVTGTLTTLNEYEKKAVRDVYKINKNSVMPSYFGRSKLRFNTNNNFAITNSVDEWQSKIFHAANSKISSGTSVLVFFKTDIDIEEFRSRFCSKFDRLYVLTVNSTDHEKKNLVEEAGVPKTITLATREMGRGVDYKSSVGVEASGGTHVIQTFFSLDVKEEIQIKGRTGRKDNDGSYELILCKQHLIKDGYTGWSSYEELHELRKMKMNEKRSDDEQNIAKAEKDHNVTMKYLKTFFK